MRSVAVTLKKCRAVQVYGFTLLYGFNPERSEHPPVIGYSVFDAEPSKAGGAHLTAVGCGVGRTTRLLWPPRPAQHALRR